MRSDITIGLVTDEEMKILIAVSIAILLLGLFNTGFGIIALVFAKMPPESYSQNIGDIVGATGASLDQWRKSWTGGALVAIASGLIISIIGVGLLKTKKWAFFLWSLFAPLFLLRQYSIAVQNSYWLKDDSSWTVLEITAVIIVLSWIGLMLPQTRRRFK